MKVLSVDDDARNRYLLEVLLKSHGHRVVSAADGVEALEKLQAGDIDLIVSDVLMPRMDGYRLCRACKQDPALRDIPFVFLTASYTEEKDETFALGLGADGFIRRPVEPDLLLRAIERIAAQHGTGRAGQGTEETRFLAEYAERVVARLEKKVQDLEIEVAARQRAEAALRESEKKFRGFAEAAEQVFWITELRPERVLYANPSFERIWGRPADELYRNPHLWLETIHPDDRARVAQQFGDWISAAPGARYRIEYRILRPDGKIEWIADRGFVVRRKEGEIACVAGIAEDITERKRTEEELRESETRYRSLIAALFEGVVLVGADGTIQAANESAAQILGVTPHEMLGRTPADLAASFIREDGSPYSYAEYPTSVTLRTGVACRNVVMSLSRPEGGVTWLLVNSQPLYRLNAPSPYAAVASFVDITEQKLLAQELERQARTDSLTGAANRRHFFEAAEQDVALSRRYRHPLSLLMLDIDHFKEVNDAHGHPTGDLALQTMVSVCRRGLRDVDVIGRVGGEEFAILLPETAPERAWQVAERLRQAVAAADIPHARGAVRITVSIGIATLDDGDAGFDALLKRADQALYEAKFKGRNVVCAACPPARPAGPLVSTR